MRKSDSLQRLLLRTPVNSKIHPRQSHSRLDRRQERLSENRRNSDSHFAWLPRDRERRLLRSRCLPILPMPARAEDKRWGYIRKYLFTPRVSGELNGRKSITTRVVGCFEFNSLIFPPVHDSARYTCDGSRTHGSRLEFGRIGGVIGRERARGRGIIKRHQWSVLPVCGDVLLYAVPVSVSPRHQSYGRAYLAVALCSSL